ncbi:MAG: hypothetical protein ABI456_10220, partial [Ktedonobacteraceae bacterium]
HTMEQEPVLHVWVHSDNDLIDLTITTATKGQHGKPAHTTREVVHTNQKHPFLTIEKGFLPVGQIVLGMHVRRADGKIGVITGWKVVPGVKTMYNLEVAQDHTFTVGDGQWVVHNSGPSCGITHTSHLDPDLPSKLKDNGVVKSGRSGGDRPTSGAPNSYVRTGGGHALIYDDHGRLLYDVDSKRVKMAVWDTRPSDGKLFQRDVKLAGPVPPEWLKLLP